MVGPWRRARRRPGIICAALVGVLTLSFAFAGC